MNDAPAAMTAEEIKAYRKDRSWTQAQLAQALGRSLRAVEEWEAGRVTAPRMLRLALKALD